MEALTKSPHRIFSVELARALFIGGEGHGYQSGETFNVQPSTSNFRSGLLHSGKLVAAKMSKEFSCRAGRNSVRPLNMNPLILLAHNSLLISFATHLPRAKRDRLQRSGGRRSDGRNVRDRLAHRRAGGDRSEEHTSELQSHSFI